MIWLVYFIYMNNIISLLMLGIIIVLYNKIHTYYISNDLFTCISIISHYEYI